MVIKGEEVRGYSLANEIVCLGCTESGDLEDLKAENILTDDLMEEGDFYFCDRCRGKI